VSMAWAFFLWNVSEFLAPPLLSRKSVISEGSFRQSAIIWQTLALLKPENSARLSYVASGWSFRYSINLKPIRTGLDNFCSRRNDRFQTFCVIALFGGGKEAGFWPFTRIFFLLLWM
jgi:hypothetical protein